MAPEVRGQEGAASSLAPRQVIRRMWGGRRDTGASQGSTFDGKAASRLREQHMIMEEDDSNSSQAHLQSVCIREEENCMEQ